MKQFANMGKSIKELILGVLCKKLLFTPHCVEQMNRPERMISVDEVREALLSGNIIEDYPDDKRGRSCLMMGFTLQKRPLHIVCSPKDDYLAIITVYGPDPNIWDATLTKRMR